MARQLRMEYPGAIYHVMNRGDYRESIFQDDQDRQRFIHTLAEACGKTGWQVLAHCLMPNHFRLVMETPRGNLVAGMKWLLGTYTGRCNRRHKLCGHLLSGRYKALIVDGSGAGYVKTVCDYVHLNPARAKLFNPTQALRDYRWSSWPEYLKPARQRWPGLSVGRVLGEYQIPRDSAAGRRQLERALEERRTAERVADNQPVRRGWDEVELQQRAKGDAQKVAIAVRLRVESAVSVQWIVARLQMGAPGYVHLLLYRQRKSKGEHINIKPVYDQRAFDILNAAADAGITFLDTADVYGAGRSETLIGKFIKKRTGKFFIATKLGRMSGLYPDKYTEAGVRAATKASLKRLGVDALDLTQLHCVPPQVLQRGEIFDWLRKLQRDGKTNKFGASVESMDQARVCLLRE
jgi:REP element-mobilizing transposase RayT